MNQISGDTHKRDVFRQVSNFLEKLGIQIKKEDRSRPWGGFFVIDNQSLHLFLSHFFLDMELIENDAELSFSPKILIVEPKRRLSWQYHNRRSEYWNVVAGKVGVVRSETDELQPLQVLAAGEKIHLRLGERHRLAGLDEWGIVAEIWQHENPEYPSDEEDIVRLADDFGR